MLSYYGYTISPNQIETGEGFLICRNVPIARTGDQEYLGRELGLEGSEADQIITVHRSPEEVFSEAALASFEGKPVTDEHPPDLLDPDNVGRYLKGHAEQIRKGSGDWDGYVIADLHILDRSLIEAVQNGKREISCGYECEYVDNGDGTYSQKHIIGNHIAVVTRGRAGKRAAILDSDTANKEQAGRPERKKMKKNGLFLKLFGQAVKNKTPEEIEQMAMDAADALEEENTAQDAPADPPKPAEGDQETGTDGAGPMNQEALIEAVAAKVMAALAARQEPEKDPIDAAIEKLTGSETPAPTAEEPKVVPAEEMDKGGCGMDQAVAVGILKQLRPAVAAIKDEKERKAVADALVATVTGNDGGDIAKILQTAQKNAQKAADSKPAMDLDKTQAAYDALNPHKNGGKKE